MKLKEIPTWVWIVGLIVLVMYLKPDFLGETTGNGDWQGILDGLIDTLKTMINSIFDLIKENALISVVIIIALFLMYGTKK